jgi:hypothetical protein
VLVQVPLLAVSVSPTRAVPEIVGGAVLTGGASVAAEPTPTTATATAAASPSTNEPVSNDFLFSIFVPPSSDAPHATRRPCRPLRRGKMSLESSSFHDFERFNPGFRIPNNSEISARHAGAGRRAKFV